PYEHRTGGGAATGSETHLSALHAWVCRVRGASRVRPSLRLVGGCAGCVSYGKRNDRTIVRAVFRGDAIEQLRRVYHSRRGGATRRVDGPVRVRPAPYVFGCLGDAARARFVVEHSPRGAVLSGTRLAYPG